MPKSQNKKLHVIPAYAGIPLLFDTPKFDQCDSSLRRNDGKSIYKIFDLTIMVERIAIPQYCGTSCNDDTMKNKCRYQKNKTR